jgi:hypothetical protein
MGVGTHRAILGAGAAAGALLLSGCAAQVPLAARAASATASECRDALPAEDEARAVASMTVLRVTASYNQHPCSGTCRIREVTLVVRPPEGVTLSRFDRMLRCHNLRVVDGELDASRIPDDPYALRDSWLEIDVKPEGDNFAVTLSGDRIADTLRILDRAKAYAAAHAASPVRRE